MIESAQSMIYKAFPPEKFRCVPTTTRLERWAEFKDIPELFDTIINYVSAGGTLVELAQVWDIPDAWLVQYVTETAERGERIKTAERVARSEWFTSMILAELRKIGTVDVTRIFDENGALKPVGEWPAECAAALESIDVVETYDKDGELTGNIKKVKFSKKDAALKLLGMQIGMFKEVKVHEGRVTLETLLTKEA